MMYEQTCMLCGGELEPQLVTHIQEYEGRWFIIENLPALVCTQCGEQFFTPESHDLVVSLLQGNSEPVRTETVAVFDAANVA